MSPPAGVRQGAVPVESRPEPPQPSPMDQATAAKRPASLCSPPGQLSAASVSTMLQTVRRSLKTGQLTQQGQPTSDHRQRLLKRMALLGVVTWAQVGGDEEQGHKGLAGVGEARKAWQGALAHEEQHMWDKLAHAPPHTRASVLAIATRQYVAKLLELHHTATQVRAPITRHHTQA